MSNLPKTVALDDEVNVSCHCVGRVYEVHMPTSHSQIRDLCHRTHAVDISQTNANMGMGILRQIVSST